MSGATACPRDGHRHSPVEWTCGVPGRAAGQPSCRWIRRECDSDSNDSCGQRFEPSQVRTFRSRGEPELILFEPAGFWLTGARPAQPSYIFIGFKPAPFHELLPTFRWRAIATTNYDLIVERAYERVGDRLQALVPFIKNGQRAGRPSDFSSASGDSENDRRALLSDARGIVRPLHNPTFPVSWTATP